MVMRVMSDLDRHLREQQRPRGFTISDRALIMTALRTAEDVQKSQEELQKRLKSLPVLIDLVWVLIVIILIFIIVAMTK